jgi:branched-chain amino acid transport system permease protein
MHMMVVILIWSFAYTSWSVMGRFGLVSLGHGGFMGVGAYSHGAVVESLSICRRGSAFPSAMVLTVALALLVAYPCFRFRITGHYFAAGHAGAVSAIVLQVITATRDYHRRLARLYARPHQGAAICWRCSSLTR